MKNILDENLLLTKEASDKIIEKASVLDCECPQHLIDILNSIRDFKKYEQTCINKNDKDKETHEWLYEAATNLDQMVSNTIVQLARLENMIDENNEIVEHPNSQKKSA